VLKSVDNAKRRLGLRPGAAAELGLSGSRPCHGRRTSPEGGPLLGTCGRMR
jgi:hypothetical protein